MKPGIEKLLKHKEVGGIYSVTASMVIAGHILTLFTILCWFTTFLIEIFTGRAIVIDPNFYTLMTFIISTCYGARPVQMGLQYVGQKYSEWKQRPDDEPEPQPKQPAQKKPQAKPTKPQAKPTTEKEKFVCDTLPYARAAEKADGISAVFRVAQGALESGWGKSGIGNNLFGITAGSTWKGKKVLKTTTEYHETDNVKYPEILSVDWSADRGMFRYKVKRYFRDYDSLTEAFIDHGRVLQSAHFKHAQPYKNDPKRFVEALQSGKSKYATSTKYVQAVHKVIDEVVTIIQKLEL